MNPTCLNEQGACLPDSTPCKGNYDCSPGEFCLVGYCDCSLDAGYCAKADVCVGDTVTITANPFKKRAAATRGAGFV